jgi:tetratricopeptide (TPR) repeat protein
MHVVLAEALIYAGQADEALARVRAAARLAPRSPGYYMVQRFEALRWNGDLDEALACARESIARSPELQIPRVNLVSVLMDLGHEGEAREAARELLALHPRFSVTAYGSGQYYIDPTHHDHVLGGLREAGLPD